MATVYFYVRICIYLNCLLLNMYWNHLKYSSHEYVFSMFISWICMQHIWMMHPKGISLLLWLDALVKFACGFPAISFEAHFVMVLFLINVVLCFHCWLCGGCLWICCFKNKSKSSTWYFGWKVCKIKLLWLFLSFFFFYMNCLFLLMTLCLLNTW